MTQRCNRQFNLSIFGLYGGQSQQIVVSNISLGAGTFVKEIYPVAAIEQTCNNDPFVAASIIKPKPPCLRVKGVAGTQQGAVSSEKLDS